MNYIQTMKQQERGLIMHNTLLPERTYDNVQEQYTVHYIVKPGNAKKHVIMRDEDLDYIYHWLMRMLADSASKQNIEPDIFEMVTTFNSKLPKSTLETTKNSLMSYIGGLLSNRYRNPSQDFTKGQLQFVEFCFDCIYFAYGENGEFDEKDLGYDIRTGVRNEPPQRVTFKEV